MSYYKQNHKYYCGIDLHARMMHVCVMDESGDVLLSRNMPTDRKRLLSALAPYREDVCVAVECMFAWYWVADMCTDEGIAFVLGHVLYMKLIHGSKSKNDKVDSERIAHLLRNGFIPEAYVYPREMRHARDLLRHRNSIVRRRAQMMSHIKNTATQLNLPQIDIKLRYKSNREGIADLFEDKAVRLSVESKLTMMETYDSEIKKLDLEVERLAKRHDPQSYALLKTIHGVGRILALTILYEIHEIMRFPRVQQFSSYSRLVKCEKSSAGKKKGTSGAKMGNAHLKWAFSEAACLFLRNNEEAKKLKQKLEKRHGKAKALTLISAKLGRAVYHMLRKNKAFDMKRFMNN